MACVIRVKYVAYVPNSNEAAALVPVDKEVLVNINCPIRAILNYIREVARIDNTREFDLCDEVNCQLMNVSLYDPCTSGINIFQPNLTYIIVTFERDENGQMINFTSLLADKASKKYCDILSKIQGSSQ